MQLRAYQDRLVKEIRSALYFGKNPLAVAPTGAGKMVMLAALAKQMRKPLLIVEHRKELVSQAVEKLRDIGEDPGVIAASFVNPFKDQGWTPNPYADIRVGMVQTLARREISDWEPEILVVDECHLSQSTSYLKLRNRWPKAMRVGLTATPERLDGKGFVPFFDALIHGPTIPDLVKLGYLSPVVMYTADVPDLSDVDIDSDGDYNSAQMETRLNTVKLVGDIVQNWLRYAKGMPTVAFATSVKHSLGVRDAFLSIGVRAAHLDGNTPDNERESILKDLRTGKLTVVCNCGILIEGVDVPNIGCVVQAFGTQSVAKYLQSIGRGSRVASGKTRCIVLDHGGNYAIHGAPDAVRVWTLDGKTPKIVVKRKEDAPEGSFDWIDPMVRPASDRGAQQGEGRPIPSQVDGELAVAPGGWLPAVNKRARPPENTYVEQNTHRISNGVVRAPTPLLRRSAASPYAPETQAGLQGGYPQSPPVVAQQAAQAQGKPPRPHTTRTVPPARPCPTWALSVRGVWDAAEQERIDHGHSLAWSGIKCRMWMLGTH